MFNNLMLFVVVPVKMILQIVMNCYI